MTLFRSFFILLASTFSCFLAQSKPNILFIAVDDLGTYLNSYGKEEVISPNMDRLAARGMTFNRAYCQIAICSPSRDSVMTGMRPDTIGVYDLATHFRDNVPDALTIPQHFRNYGYHAQAIGKVFHPALEKHPIREDQPRPGDPHSWSVPTYRPHPPEYYHTPEGVEEARRVFAQRQIKEEETPDDWKNYLVRGFVTEAPDVDDEALYDGQVAARAMKVLRELANTQQQEGPGNKTPFFLGVGFLKPHMPFIAPRKYWDLYDRENIRLAENNFPPRDAPPIALQVHWNEARAQSDVPNDGPILPEQSREMIHGYYAAVSYVDALVGRLLDALDELGLRDDTIIMLWGDHGYMLGEHSLWGKLTNFEQSVRVPLIVSLPDGKGSGMKTNALVELTDMYPSLCDFAGLPLPDHLEGTSFAPIMEDPDRPWKSAAFSQYLRRPFENYRIIPLAIPNLEGYGEYPQGGSMGYTMRTDRYRFTVWHSWKNKDEILAIELYDYMEDPQENVNIAGRMENKGLVATLMKQYKKGWRGALPPQ